MEYIQRVMSILDDAEGTLHSERDKLIEKLRYWTEYETSDIGDRAKRSSELDEVTIMLERNYKRTRAIRERIDRITFDKYDGTCVDCGEPIETERLKIVPWTSLCKACATGA